MHGDRDRVEHRGPCLLCHAAAAKLRAPAAQTFGETAIGLLDGRFQARARGAPGTRGALAPGADFAACFAHHGGPQVLGELGALGSECERALARLRGTLAPEARAALDAAGAALAPAFDLQARVRRAPHAGTACRPHGRSAVPRARAACGWSALSACMHALPSLHARSAGASSELSVRTGPPLCSEPSSAHWWQRLYAWCVGPRRATPPATRMSAKQWRGGMPLSLPSVPKVRPWDPGTRTHLHTVIQCVAAAPCVELRCSLGRALREALRRRGPGVDRAAALACADGPAAPADIAAEGRRRLAELAAVAAERLLALGRSLALQFRERRPADDGIRWPPAPGAKAALLRGQAGRMLAALESLGGAFAAAAAAAARQAERERAGAAGAAGAAPAAGAAAGDGGAGGGGAAARAALGEDGRAAAARLGDALRALLPMALLASQDWGAVYGQA